MKTKLLIGVDIGGTTVKLAFVSLDGDIISKWEINTNTENGGKHIVSDITETIEERLKEGNIDKSQVAGIGIGAPGFIDMKNGMFYDAVNIGWKNYYLKEEVEKMIHLPTFVDNDANLAAVGEMWQGAGEGAENLLCVTLGTGVGGGIIAGGEIIHGQAGMAGEIGHITSIVDGGAPCNCGKAGCLETVASATGIARMARESIKKNPVGLLKSFLDDPGELTAKDVFDAAKQEDPLALSIVNDSARHLGLALANLANALNPETIVIGGGVSKAGEFLIDEIGKYFKQFTIPKIGNETVFRIASLGNDAGVVGAAWLVKENVDC